MSRKCESGASAAKFAFVNVNGSFCADVTRITLLLLPVLPKALVRSMGQFAPGLLTSCSTAKIGFVTGSGRPAIGNPRTIETITRLWRLFGISTKSGQLTTWLQMLVSRNGATPT